MNERTTAKNKKCFAAANMTNLLKRLNKVVMTAGFIFLVTILTACSQQEPIEESLEDSLEISSEKIEVPDVVLEIAEQYVEQKYISQNENKTDWSNDYSDWRIESLSYVYTYDDLDGMTLQIYRLNYEFLADDPDNVTLVGGMTINAEGWVVPEYANSTYFAFEQDGEELSYLISLFENDCHPGDEVFTNDLRRWLSTDNNSETTKEPTEQLILGELAEMQGEAQSGNQIPQWVTDADWDKPMYVMSSPDIEKFDNYAKENFPNFCGWGWTQEQSDEVYLGKGIESINLDGETRLFRTV